MEHKLAYGNEKNIGAAMESGLIDSGTLVFSKEKHLYFVGPGKEPIELKTRNEVFNSIGEAEAFVSASPSVSAGDILTVQNGRSNGLYFVTGKSPAVLHKVPLTLEDIGADKAGSADAVQIYVDEKLESKVGKSTLASAVIGTAWFGDAPPYTQNIAVAEATATNVVEVKLTSTATDDQVWEYQALNLQDGGQVDGSITLRSFGVKNTAEIPISIIARRDL